MAAAFRTWTLYASARAGWKAFVADKNELLERKRLSSALVVWRNRRKVSNFGRKIFIGWQQREMAAAFRTWTLYASARAGWKAFVADKNELLERKRLSSALVVWRNRRKVSNFGRKIFIGWQQREMAAAFRTWTAYIQSKSEWKAHCLTQEEQILTSRTRLSLRHWNQKVRENKSMRMIIRNMTNSKVGASLRRWKECVSQRQENREKLKQAFKYMTNGLLAKSFRSWISYTVRSKSLKSQTAAVLEMIIVSRRRTTFSLWHSLLKEKQLDRIGDAHFRLKETRLSLAKWLLWRRERAKSRKAIEDSRSVIARAKVRNIFLSWSFYTIKATLLRAQVEHMVRTRQKTEQIAALRIWRDCAHTRRVNKTVIGEALERMSTLRLRALTNHWLAVSRAAQTKRAERLDAFLLQVEKKRKAAVFDHMRLHYVLFRARKMAVATILSRRCFRVWFRESVLAKKRMQALEAIFELKLRSRMRRGLDAFIAKVAAEKERRQNNSRLQLAALVIHLGAARRSIAVWRHETAVARLTRTSYNMAGPKVKSASRATSQRSSIDYGSRQQQQQQQQQQRRTKNKIAVVPEADDGLEWLRSMS
jgi:hypothetical protein